MLDLDTELDIIFHGVDDYCLEGKFKTVDLILSQVDVEAWPTTVLVGFLSITWLANSRGLLNNYVSLRDKIKESDPRAELWRGTTW